MIELGTPLWLLAGLLILARVLLMWKDRAQARGAFLFSSLSLIETKRSWRTRLSWLPFVLEMVGLALLVVAIARPREVVSVADEKMGIDIAIVLDASGSMAAEDFRPRNRFAVARSLIDRFIGQRANDRIGIITFGSRAATRVPVTFDRRIARQALDEVQVGENGDGTAIGHAIATAVNRLRPSTARSKVMILLTDGVNNAGSIDPATAAELAQRNGIKIYAIGVGSQGPVPVPVKAQNRVTGELEIVYHLIRADLDDEMLTSIAEKTSGSYFRATDEKALEEILERIDQLEKTRLEAPKSQTVSELYPAPAAAGLWLLVLSIVAGETIWMRLSA